MIRLDDNIQDDELRVLGKPSPEEPKKKGFKWYNAVAILLILSGVIFAAVRLFDIQRNEIVPDFYETELSDTIAMSETIPVMEKLGNYKDSSKAYTEHIEMTVNDIPLDIYIPHNAKPRLFIGTPDLNDKNVIFTTQAADIRADNGKINGAFVLAGEPKAWGLSKKGYCGIIDGKITIGVAANSPLFEEATETGGYFFRQYPLVDNGKLVENEPKGKAIRKAICDRGGEILVVMTQEPESFHDFSQALIDIGVGNAVYLVGSVSYGYFRDKLDQLSIIYNKQRGGQKYENHIQWVIKP